MKAAFTSAEKDNILNLISKLFAEARRREHQHKETEVLTDVQILKVYNKETDTTCTALAQEIYDFARAIEREVLSSKAAEPVAYMFTTKTGGTKFPQCRTFAAIDFTPSYDDTEIISKEPLYAAPTPCASCEEKEKEIEKLKTAGGKLVSQVMSQQDTIAQQAETISDLQTRITGYMELVITLETALRSVADDWDGEHWHDGGDYFMPIVKAALNELYARRCT